MELNSQIKHNSPLVFTIHKVTMNASGKGCGNVFKKTNYFVSGNTSQGYINYLNNNIKGINNIVMLKHPSSTLKNAVLSSLLNHYSTRCHSEVIHSPFVSGHLAGLILRDQSIAIITDEITPSNLLPTTEIDLERYFEVDEDVSFIQLKTSDYLNDAYAKLSKGLAIHDELEKIYINEMDFVKADQLTNSFIKDLLKMESKQKRTPHIFHRFFGTTTANGAVNVLPQIIKDLSRRVYIKGRAGTGKSVFMKKVAKACQDLGLDTELYHCSFDPDSLDMVVVPDLDFCIFDSTAPHELLPEKADDVVIDLYDAAVEAGTDEKHATEINGVTLRYQAFVQRGIHCLKKAQNEQDLIEAEFKCVDKNKIIEVTNVILKHTLS